MFFIAGSPPVKAAVFRIHCFEHQRNGFCFPLHWGLSDLFL